MKAKRKSDGEIVEVKEWKGATDLFYATPTMSELYKASDLDFTLSEPEEEVTMSGWVARDPDGSLNVFPERPTKVANDFWMGEHCYYLLRDIQYECDNALPSVSFENSPQEVTITIKPKKK